MAKYLRLRFANTNQNIVTAGLNQPITMYGAPGRTRTCNHRLSLPTTVFTASLRVCGLDYLFTITGATHIVSTEPYDNQKQILPAFSDYSWEVLPSSMHVSQIVSDQDSSIHRYQDSKCNKDQRLPYSQGRYVSHVYLSNRLKT